MEGDRDMEGGGIEKLNRYSTSLGKKTGIRFGKKNRKDTGILFGKKN